MEIEKLLHTDNWFNYSKFYDWISTKDFKTLVEIGVWKGHSISYLANKLRNENCEIFAVDLFDSTYRYEAPQYKSLNDQVPLIYAIYNDNLKRTNTRNLIQDIKDYSWQSAERFKDNTFDFIFIDADHTYESVVKDIDAWYPKIKQGGIFSGHDYSAWGGVTKAVNEFVKDKNLKLKTYGGDVWYVEA